MKRWIGIVLVLITLVALGLLWIVKYCGLGEYARARQAIDKLPIEQQDKARASFVGSGDPNLYGGILAGITKIGSPRVWVWGRRGLQYFLTDEYTVYSYFSACEERVLSTMTKGGATEIGRIVTADLAEWERKARAGDFVVVMITREGNGGVIGNAREIKGHDWWGFVPTDIRKQCAK